MYAEGDYVGINENAGADNAAHDNHGGVENSKQLPGLDRVQRRLAQAKFSLSLQKGGSGAGLTATTLPQSAKLNSGECWKFKPRSSVFSFQFSVPS